MKKQDKLGSDPFNIRRKAEKVLKKRPLETNTDVSESDALRLLHELQVYQIELELQNDELKLAKETAEVASLKYAEFYDFAPTGYFTLSREGKIKELNFSGAQMLGKERLNLKNSLFESYVSEDTRPIYNHFLKVLFNSKTWETCEVNLSPINCPRLDVYLTGIITKDEIECFVTAIDISERKYAEQALRESEERNHDIILHTSMDGFWLFDKFGFLLEVNDTYCRMSGYSKQELLTLRIPSLEAVESENHIDSHLKQVFLQGENRFETRHRRKDGSIFDVEVSIQSRPVNEGQFVAFIHDITERKQAEIALQKSEKSLLDIYTSMSEGLSITEIIYDADGKAVDYVLIDANPAFEKITGQKLSEVIGKRGSDSYSMEIASHFDVYAHVASSGEPIHFEPYLASVNKYLSISAFSPEKGKFASIFRDVTEIKLAEKALVESNEQFQLLFKNSSDAILFTNPDGSISSANPEAERMLERSNDEIVALGRVGISNPSDPRLIPSLEERRKTGTFKGELTYLRKDGSIFPVDVTSTLFKDSNGIERSSIIARDITKRKKAELNLVLSEKRYRDLFNSMIEGFCLIEMVFDEHMKAIDYRFLETNGSYEEQSGLANVVGKSMRTIVPDYEEFWYEIYGEIALTGQLMRFEKESKALGRWFEVCAFRMEGEGSRKVAICFSDISKRKRSEESILKNNARLTLAMKVSDMAWWEMNIVTGAIAFDKRKAEMLGYLPENFKHYNDFMKLVHPEDAERAMDAMRRHIYGSADKYEVEYRMLAQSGEYKWFHDIGSITKRDANGKAILATGLVTNITARKKAEQIIKEGEERRLGILQTAMDGYWLLDLNGRLLEVNDTYCLMSGYNKQELLSMQISDLENFETVMDIQTRIQNIIEQGESRFETCHRRKDGSIFDVEASVQFQPGEGGQLIVFMHDITEHKQSELALSEKERLLRESQAVAHIGSFSANLINKSWKASPEIYKIFGIDESYSNTLDAWIGAINPDFREEFTKDLFKVKDGVKQFEHEYKIIRVNDGLERWIYGFGEYEYDNNTDPFRLVGTIQDITERKIKEKALHKLNHTLAALGKSSQAMAQAVDEAEYLKQVCKIIVEDTKFEMVWIGFAQDDQAKTILPMASAGLSEDYLQSINLSWGDTEFGRGPTGTAIRTGKVSLCNNMLTDPTFAPWREQALKRGYASSIVFPLKSGYKTFGALTIYSNKADSFLNDEIQLLSELANDLAYGITTIQLQEAHALAKEALNKSHYILEELVKERTKQLQITNNLLNKEIENVKLKKQSLILAEEKYRTVADYTHGWEFWLDKDDHFFYCSPSCERITGHKASEFIQNPGLLFDIIHPDDLKNYRSHKITEHLSQVVNHDLEYRIVHTDGSIRWISHECQPITNEAGQFKGIRGSNKDITERKEIEQLLKINNQKYRLLSENITDGIFICKSGRLEYVNKAMNHIFGYPDYKMDGLMLNQLVLPEYHQELNDILSIKSSVNKLQTIEIECSKKDHSKIYVEIIFNFIAKENMIYGVVHDITDKKQLQKNIVKAIIQTEEKERAYFSKELHDGLGPLLSTIKLYLQWSERPKTTILREDIIRKAEIILEEALTAVKEISNKLSPHLLNYYGLTSAIQSFVDKLDETSACKIVFESNSNRRIGNEIEASLYRVIIECINNTIKYAEASAININLNDTGSQLILQYKDDGKGFDLEYILSIKKGLGLFNLQSRIQTIGGKINLFSEPGKGVDYQFSVDL